MVYQIAKLANITSNKLWFMIARTAKLFMGNINQLKHLSIRKNGGTVL